MTVQMIK